jgi:WD40 repeat protein
MVFSGQNLVLGSRDGTMRLWEIMTGKEIRTFYGHTWVVISIAFSWDGKTIISGSKDGEIKIWDVQTGSLLASLVSFNNDRWVAYTPDNYSICSRYGEEYVTFRVGNYIYDSNKYASLFNKADVVADKLQMKNVQSPNIETTKPVDKQPFDIHATPGNEPTTVKTPGSIQPPTVVISS